MTRFFTWSGRAGRCTSVPGEGCVRTETTAPGWSKSWHTAQGPELLVLLTALSLLLLLLASSASTTVLPVLLPVLLLLLCLLLLWALVCSMERTVELYTQIQESGSRLEMMGLRNSGVARGKLMWRHGREEKNV